MSVSLEYDTRATIPVSNAFAYNLNNAHHFANIRRDDLIVLARRIPPRPLPSRDSARPYNTLSRPQKEYVSARESHLAQVLERRPITTRRNYE